MNGRSTVTQLLETLEYWPRHLVSGLAIEAIYLDFQKAFDSVRQRLLKKLRSYGVREQVYSENANKKLLWMGPNQTEPMLRAGSHGEAYLGHSFL